ncbi:MAG: hypothetical protein Kow00104_14880 [Rhodothalassiaceae bacterium]
MGVGIVMIMLSRKLYERLCNLRFGKRLSVGFLLVGFLLLATGSVGIRQAFNLADITERLYRHPFAVSSAIRDVQAGIFAIHRDMKAIALTSDRAEIDRMSEDVGRHDTQVREALALIDDRFLGDKSDVVRLIRGYEEWQKVLGDYMEAKRRGQQALAAEIARTRGEEAVAALMASADEVRSFASEKADSFMKSAKATKSFALWLLVGILLLAIALSIAVSLVITHSVTGPMEALRASMERLAGGETALDIPMRDNRDEIGDMARTVEVFRQNALARNEAEAAARAAAEEAARQEEERRRLEAEQQAREREEREKTQRRAEMLDALVVEFENRVVDIMGALSSAASEMTEMANSLGEVATGTAERSRTVSEAGEEASRNVATAAGAAEQMSAAIHEISRQVGLANKVAGDAVQEVKASSDKVKALQGSASRVGEVVTLINEIAEQTNLLALNATIEAARAGEAGKGFAVVASEVKALAAQTRKAIEEISMLVSGIQTSGQEAVATMSRMDEVIAKISEANANIASAIEQQSGATGEIARNVQQAAAGTNRVAEEIAGVSEGANLTGRAAEKMQDSARELKHLAAEIENRIKSFINGVRAA